MKFEVVSCIMLLVLAMLASGVTRAAASVLETRYASVSYEDVELLLTFNRKVKLGGTGFSFGKTVNTSLESETRKKINQINGRVQEILEMKPLNMKINIVLLPNKEEVQKIYRERYNKTVDFIAFYSPDNKTAYFSVKDLRLRVYAHEIAHAVINHYFEKDPPVKIHEMLAQYVETKI